MFDLTKKKEKKNLYQQRQETSVLFMLQVIKNPSNFGP